MSVLNALVVDDDNLISWGLQKALTGLGLHVEVAGAGADALALLREKPYQLVCLDIHLPDASGLDLLPQVRALAPGAKIVMLSSAGTAGNRRRAHEDGAWQFIAKPFELSEVVSLVRAAFGEHGATRRSERRLCPVPLRVAVLDGDRAASGDPLQYVEATTVDVGAGGLRLHTDYPLQPGQWVKASPLGGELPCAELIRQDAPAEVVWVVPEHGGFTAGLRYLS